VTAHESKAWTPPMDDSKTARKTKLDKALVLFRQAYDHQMSGELDEAIQLYRASIEQHPTAEAHTFLGWTYSFQGRLEDAIAECHKAIVVDPAFGNPYNDIGAYLLEMERPDDAIPWLERATEAARYESYQFPWFNLGRAYEAKEQLARAIECYVQALQHDAEYAPAQKALRAARLQIN
jgi:Tfp pilus assembly protein PilF